MTVLTFQHQGVDSSLEGPEKQVQGIRAPDLMDH